MIYVLYGIVLWLALPVIVAYHWWRSVSRGRPAALAPRFGFVRPEVLAPLEKSEVIWVHSVSVGETIAVEPLLKALKKHWPHRKIALSTMTETGREVAGKIPEADCLLYFPFDYRFAVKRLLRLVNPSLIIIVETEIWPHFLRCARMRNTPVVMVNGRISDRSARRYFTFRWFFRPVLDMVSAFCMQSEEDSRRIVSIGAEPTRVHVTGNLKYDVPVLRLNAAERGEIRASYSIPADALVFTAGSTHAGEDEVVAGAFSAVAATTPGLVLVLAPRHPERTVAVADILTRRGIPFRLRSKLDAERIAFPPGEALLVDTVGELKRLYSISDVVFVGGSLVPTGGHNVLEPAAFGVPVLFGPHMSNFREISAALLEHGGGIQIADGAALEKELHSLCADEDRRLAVGNNGMEWLRGSSGSVARHMDVIAQVMDGNKRQRL